MEDRSAEVASLFSSTLFPFTASAAQTVVFLTSGTSWTVPSDWTNTNTIEVIGGGGGASTGDTARGAGAGGGGGAYSEINNQSLSDGASVTIQVGTGGGYTLDETAARLQKKAHRHVSTSTITAWLEEYKQHCSYRRLRRARPQPLPAKVIRGCRRRDRAVRRVRIDCAHHRWRAVLVPEWAKVATVFAAWRY